MMTAAFHSGDRETNGFDAFLSVLVLLLCFAVSSAARASWSTKAALDNLTGEPFIVASAHARQSDSGNPKSKAIHVRCKNGKIDAYINWGHAIDTDYGMEVRFDRHNPMALPVSEAAKPETAFIQLSSDEQKRFLRLMKASNLLAVRLYNWPGQAVQAKFSLAGSNKAIREVERVCTRMQKQKERETAKTISRYQAAYKAAIGAAVRRNWVRPAGAPADVKCRVRVKKFPDGEVITAELINSCGSTVLDESVIDAVYQSSPFPKPRDPSLFVREITFEFSSR
jgi:TonB family protein